MMKDTALQQIPELAESLAIDELAVLVARLTAQRANAEAVSEKLDAESDAALYAGSDAAVDRLERQAKAARRAKRQAEIALPILQRRLFEAEQADIARRVDGHRLAMDEQQVRVATALAALLDANAAARAAFERAAEDVGYAVAVSRVPAAHCEGLMIQPENVERWCLAKDHEFGRVARAEIKRDVVTVTFRCAHGCYAPGESAAFSPAQAAVLSGRGVADIEPGTAFELPFDPRFAEPPEPDGAGRVLVVMVRPVEDFPRHELREAGWQSGGYQPGDVLSLVAAQAAVYVRNGAAEYPPYAYERAKTGRVKDPVSEQTAESAS